MALMLKFDLEIFYYTTEGISSLKIQLSENNLEEKRKNLQLMMANDGYFDVVYAKSFIKSAGICQSLIFEVREYYQ